MIENFANWTIPGIVLVHLGMFLRFRGHIIIAAIFGFLATASPARAQLDFGGLLNPGPLAKAHQELEGLSKCTDCHATAKGVPDQKCLDCHTEIASLVSKDKGYHARVEGTCIECHSDHKGLDYDLMGLTRLSFHHDETDWPLDGAHVTAQCEDCHKAKRRHVKTGRKTNTRTYINTPSKCASCHEDIHKSKTQSFTLCEKCHNTSKWSPILARLPFDHDRDTKYPLTGKHKPVDCYACHKNKLWKPTPFKRCSNCHVDPHKGKLGKDCKKCHHTRSWRAITPKGKGEFDHSKTAFPLRGEHNYVTCVRCHGPVIGKMKNFSQCSGCHNNPHGNQFEILWTEKKTCKSCHIEDGWKFLKFNHEKDARFKLEGKHKVVPCGQCHADAKYRWLNQNPDCSYCHIDVHKGQFGKKTCASCHTFSAFKNLTFDHNRQSRFPLVGKHQNVPCADCHSNGRYAGIDTLCQNCHTDFHKGELGIECMRCHAPIAFNDIEFDHERGSRFNLRGQHRKLACNQCHKDYQYKFESSECSSCHRDVHDGTFGTNCERCHVFEGFSVRKGGFHDFGEFSLGGVHDQMDCTACHNATENVRTSRTDCAACHLDPHMNSFGRTCWQCHNQQAWLPTTFRHSQTGFDLSGAHRFLDCNQCHANRIFGGLPQDCHFCHAKDFDATITGHVGAPITCETCHFTFGWRPAKP